MYRLFDDYNNIIDELINPTWPKQQKRVDRPISANSLEEADGVVLSDGETMVGIKGRNMQNYPPLVTVEEVSGETYILTELYTMKTQLNEVYQHQTEEAVLRSELDAAYTQGVNAI